MTVSGKIIAITGGSGGLAQALVAQLARDNQLLILGRDKATLAALYGHLEAVRVYELDISQPEAIASWVEEVYAEFGQLDIFINNAGYGRFASYDSFTDQEVADMFAVNTFASMTFCRLIGQRMAEAGSGQLVNIVSMAGLIASQKSSVYSASKFALIGFSNALRLELADHGVFVLTVNPGPIQTGFFDQADPTGDYLKSVQAFSLTADQVATRICQHLGKPTRELNMPLSLALAHKLYTLFPRLSDVLARKVFNYK